MDSSAGTLAQSYDKYLNSVEAHVNSFKAAFQSLSKTVASSSLLKTVIKSGTSFLGLLNGIIGALNSIGGILPIITGFISFIIARNFTRIISGLSGSLPNIVSGFMNIAKAIKAIKFASSGLAGPSMSSGGILGLLTNPNTIAFAVTAVTAIAGIIINAVENSKRKVEEARQAAQQAAQELQQKQSSRTEKVDNSIERIYEIKELIEGGSLSTSELYEAQAELVGIKDELVDVLGEDAEAIDILGESADNTSEAIRRMNDEMTVAEASAFIHSNKEAYEDAVDALYDYSAKIKIGSYQSYGQDNPYKALYDEISKATNQYGSLSFYTDYRGNGSAAHWDYDIRINAEDVYTAREQLGLLYDDLERLKKKYLNDPDKLGRITSAQELISSQIAEINSSIEEYEGIYQQWQISTIIANDSYREVFNKFKEAQKAYNDALYGVFDTPEERAAAIEAALEQMDAVKILLDNTDFSNDPEAQKYIQEQIDGFEKAASRERARIKIRANLDFEFEYADGKRGKYGEVLAGLLKSFVGEDGTFTLKDILNVKAVVDEKEAEAAASGVDPEWTEQELAYKALRSAAEAYGIELEDLIYVLDDLGVINIDTNSQLSKTINQITGLSEKVEGATARVEAFNEAMKAGEKGDAASGYASVYDRFIKDWDAGKRGSNAVAAAIDTFFSPEMLAKYNYDIDKLGEILSGRMYRAIFADGGDYGLNFVNYIRDTYGDAVDGIYKIVENADGSFSISIEDFDLLAGLLDLDSDLFYALIDAMDLWGTEIMADDKMVQKLAEDIGLIGKDAPVENIDRIRTAISGLYDSGARSPTQIMNMLKLLSEAGYIDIDLETNGEEVLTLIQEVFDEKAALEEEGPKITITSNAVDITGDIDSLNDAIARIPRFVAIQFAPQGAIDAIKKVQSLFGLPGAATGTKDAPGGPTLVNELGPELISSGGEAYIAAGGKPTIVDLDPGDIVLNAKDTKYALSGLNKRLPKRLHIRAAAAGYDPKYCPRCGTPNPKHYTRCMACGYDFTGKSNAPSTTTDATFPTGTQTSEGVNTGGGGSGGNGSSGSKDGDNWFEKQYAEHKHLLEMDQESLKDFLDWLNDAYKRAYDEGIIDLKEYRQREEEVYKGRQDDFKDHLNDTEHLIELEKNGDNSPTVIFNLYQQMMADIQAELEKCYAQGLDSTNTYVQYLQNTWIKYNDKLKDTQEEAAEDAKGQVKDLVDYRIKMLKQYLKNEIDNYKKRISYLKDFYDKQKELLQDEYDQEEYLDEQAEKRKTISDIQAELASLEYDDSAWAQKRKQKLLEQLADAEKDLGKFEKQHALELAQDQLDEAYEAQVKELEAKIEELEEKLNNPQYLYETALRDVQNNSEALYQEMIEYNYKYGTGIKQDIVDMWEEAYKSLKRYHDLYGEYYKDINLVNATGYVEQPGDSSVIIPRGGYASGTSHATRGLHRFDELGTEYIFESKDGNKYRMFADGDKVLNANAANFLYKFATSGGQILSGMVDKAQSPSSLTSLNKMPGIAEIKMGDIIIHGNANERTVSEIRRAQRESVEFMLKEFTRLNK